MPSSDTPRASRPCWRLRRASSWIHRLLTGCVLGLLVRCTATSAPGVSAPEQAGSAPRVWDYHVQAGPGARELRVEVTLPPGVPEQLGVDSYAHPFAEGVALATADGWQPVARSGSGWHVPRCRARGCRLRYRYHLGDAAEKIDRFAYAGYRAGALLAPPSTFLIAPQGYAGGDTYQLRVDTAPGESFVSGVWRDGEPWAAPAELLFEAPFSGFGRFEQRRLQVGASTIDVAVAPGAARLRVSPAELDAALLRGAAAVSDYYGRFPVPNVTLIVLPSPGREIFGMQLGNGGASVVLFLGTELDAAALARDWVVVHELLHLGFPTLDRRYLWLAEGLATYQEPLVRARAGLLGEADLWRGYLQGLPKGLPGASDPGLDGNGRWGRTYWGGALVFLLLDVELRARSLPGQNLDAAARSILQRGGDTSVRWTLERTLAAGDAALDQPSLSAAYARFASTPERVDLDALFLRLGVRLEGGEVRFDEGAELAEVRRLLLAPEAKAAEQHTHDGQTGLAVPGVPKSPL
jgi:hypothetical protein